MSRWLRRRGLLRGPHRQFARHVGVLAALLLGVAALQAMGVSATPLTLIFLGALLLLFAVLGIKGRSGTPEPYYVASRRVPAVYNGMATAADWLSAASFMGLAGLLYLDATTGVAFVLGWTGGFCLLAILLAPYLRRFGQYTVGDFLSARYESQALRVGSVLATLLCSFVYVVAQIYAIGLIATRLMGVDFVLGTFFGLGGILLCAFLGGMQAVTRTQVVQYLIIAVACVAPWLWMNSQGQDSPKKHAQWLQRVAAIQNDPREAEVQALLQMRARDLQQRLRNVPQALSLDRELALGRVQEAVLARLPLHEIQALERERLRLPNNEDQAKAQWSQEYAWTQQQLASMPRLRNPDAAVAFSKREGRNFFALVLCLMLGTASLPHVLGRLQTAPSPASARWSVVWALLFVVLIYAMTPHLAHWVREAVVLEWVGQPHAALPPDLRKGWGVEGALMQAVDVNRDGLLQWSEFHLGKEGVTLSMPQLLHFPPWLTAWVAGGALAAALSTADGLLLTMSTTLSHDVYDRLLQGQAQPQQRVLLAKVLLLLLALAATWVASMQVADIIALVTGAFSLAASAFFPVLVAGVFWQRANAWGALASMVTGVVVVMACFAQGHPTVRDWLGWEGLPTLWWGIQPLAAGVFGVPAAALMLVVVSLCTRAPGALALQTLDRIRNID